MPSGDREDHLNYYNALPRNWFGRIHLEFPFYPTGRTGVTEKGKNPPSANGRGKWIRPASVGVRPKTQRKPRENWTAAAIHGGEVALIVQYRPSRGVLATFGRKFFMDKDIHNPEYP